MIPTNTFKLKRSYRIALWVVFFIAAGAILAGLYMYNMHDKDLQKVKPDFIITAAELQRAFEADEVAAASDYIDRIIEVTGEVESVKPGESNSLVVTLKTGNPLSAVSCTFLPGSETPEFTSGDQATIRGRCSGFLMDVLLNNCTAVSQPK